MSNAEKLASATFTDDAGESPQQADEVEKCIRAGNGKAAATPHEGAPMRGRGRYRGRGGFRNDAAQEGAAAPARGGGFVGRGRGAFRNVGTPRQPQVTRLTIGWLENGTKIVVNDLGCFGILPPDFMVALATFLKENKANVCKPFTSVPARYQICVSSDGTSTVSKPKPEDIPQPSTLAAQLIALLNTHHML